MNSDGLEKFALGMIVAVIVFLLLRREFGKHAATPNGSMSLETGGSHGTSKSTGGGCGCGGQGKAEVIPIGGESYTATGSYGASSVTPETTDTENDLAFEKSFLMGLKTTYG